LAIASVSKKRSLWAKIRDSDRTMMTLMMISLAGNYKMVFRDLSSFVPIKINWYSGVSGYSFVSGIKAQGVDKCTEAVFSYCEKKTNEIAFLLPGVDGALGFCYFALL
jgi:hypothetical protein